MTLRIARQVTLMFLALSMAPAIAHFLEMPAKLRYDGGLWLHLLQTLYVAFGTVGAVFEVGAVGMTVVLAYLTRHRGPAFRWTLFAAVVMILVHAAYWVWIAPVNAEMRPLSAATLPSDWTQLRFQWEYAHAVRAFFEWIAFSAIVFSILIETPETIPPREVRRGD